MEISTHVMHVLLKVIVNSSQGINPVLEGKLLKHLWIILFRLEWESFLRVIIPVLHHKMGCNEDMMIALSLTTYMTGTPPTKKRDVIRSTAMSYNTIDLQPFNKCHFH